MAKTNTKIPKKSAESAGSPVRPKPFRQSVESLDEKRAQDYNASKRGKTIQQSELPCEKLKF
jgi:hypothetical protein